MCNLGILKKLTKKLRPRRPVTHVIIVVPLNFINVNFVTIIVDKVDSFNPNAVTVNTTYYGHESSGDDSDDESQL